ncbi:hypothetical protein [Desulfohalovibrio reitneri]|uniref:hypothetical protein n=1 Tax=Desulfohalovibrio reitneri TaxID=1307759 RepID=UPI0004A71D0E|nr:hypothetical protein [Desulfohalovibrio reitneri]
MAEYTEADLPVRIHHGETIVLPGTTVRFEGNGEAKDVFLGDSFAPAIQLFPDCEYTFQDGGHTYRCLAAFDDSMEVARLD